MISYGLPRGQFVAARGLPPVDVAAEIQAGEGCGCQGVAVGWGSSAHRLRYAPESVNLDSSPGENDKFEVPARHAGAARLNLGYRGSRPFKSSDQSPRLFPGAHPWLAPSPQDLRLFWLPVHISEKWCAAFGLLAQRQPASATSGW